MRSVKQGIYSSVSEISCLNFFLFYFRFQFPLTLNKVFLGSVDKGIFIVIMKTCRLCTFYLNCFILIHLMILIQINSGFERKKRHNEYESDDTISDTKKSTFINADLIYCHKDYLQHHFCVFADKFKIAENNTFQCNDKYFT